MLCDTMWPTANFASEILETAMHCFSGVRQTYETFNGVFAVTPDGMPLAGKISDGLYVAAAVWITHAAGISTLVADMVIGTEPGKKDIELQNAFDPKRFEGQDPGALRKQALATYNDIYNQVQSI